MLTIEGDPKQDTTGLQEHDRFIAARLANQEVPEPFVKSDHHQFLKTKFCQHSLHLYISNTKKALRPDSLPAPKILLLAPNSPEGAHAEKLLQGKSIPYLVVRPVEPLDNDDEVEVDPILIAGSDRYPGISEIKRFINNYSESMDSERIARTLRVLNQLGIKPVMTSFSTRLRVQKILYLLQELGLQTGWKFSWYIRGPYSPDLAHELFEHHEKAVKELREEEDEKKSIRQFREKFGDSALSAQQLEAAAAIIYVAKSTGLRSASLAVRVSKEKPYLPGQLIEDYVKRLYPS